MTVSMCDRRLFGCSAGWLPDEWPWSPMRWQPQAAGTGDTASATWTLRLPSGVARVIGRNFDCRLHTHLGRCGRLRRTDRGPDTPRGHRSRNSHPRSDPGSRR